MRSPKKSVEIAVPLEQLGYERAEELKTNLEKWLPDTPDREKWSQEESLSDKDKEAPMAELPGELEDLVGELMEQEEDLMDEAEDVSSSAADSLDKGAGWDAMDGPISDMSGKGVTGNRLPNGSEIGGRSGEGRQGKSSGEFVGDEAVGKGGRRTPSRLTPDPYRQGPDQGPQPSRPPAAPPAAARKAAKGAKGSRAPCPKRPGPRDAGRLADRQATLRNQAEGPRPALPGVELPSHRSEEAGRGHGAGRAGLAFRALSATHFASSDMLLEGFRNVKQYLEGEAEVRQDASSNLPTDVQKKILGAMQEAFASRLGGAQSAVFRAAQWGRGGEEEREERREGRGHKSPGDAGGEVTGRLQYANCNLRHSERSEESGKPLELRHSERSEEPSKPLELRHSERSEESSLRRKSGKILRCAQNDAMRAQNDAMRAQIDAMRT